MRGSDRDASADRHETYLSPVTSPAVINDRAYEPLRLANLFYNNRLRFPMYERVGVDGD